MSRNSEKVDPLTITNKMEQFGFDVAGNGGISGVVDVMNTVAFSSNMDSYCKIVKDKSDMKSFIHN